MASLIDEVKFVRKKNAPKRKAVKVFGDHGMPHSVDPFLEWLDRNPLIFVPLPVVNEFRFGQHSIATKQQAKRKTKLHNRAINDLYMKGVHMTSASPPLANLAVKVKDELQKNAEKKAEALPKKEDKPEKRDAKQNPDWRRMRESVYEPDPERLLNLQSYSSDGMSFSYLSDPRVLFGHVDAEEVEDATPIDGEGQPDEEEGKEEEEYVFDPPPLPYSYEMYEAERDAAKDVTKWRILQRERWENGYVTESGVRLTGPHYFYLTQIKLKTPSGKTIPASWRDVDAELFDLYEDCCNKGMDMAIFKRRGVGLSSIFGACIPIWTSIVFPGSVNLMTSADKGRVTGMFDQKFMISYNLLEDWVKPKQVSKLANDGVISFQVTDHNGKDLESPSWVKCRQTSQDRKDTSNFEGERAKSLLIDELFLHPFAEEVRLATESCIMDDLSRIGICVFGGSAGLISKSGLKQAEKTWADRDKGSVACVFISGAKGIMNADEKDEYGKVTKVSFMKNGYSDIVGATRWILKKRRSLAELSDKKHLASFVKRYPLEIEEVFGLSELGALPDDIKEMVVERKKFLMNNKPVLKRVCVDKLANERYETRKNDQGGWVVFEDPVPNERYIMGVDPTPSADEESANVINPDDTRLSLFAAAIKRVSTDTYVAVYQKKMMSADGTFDDIYGMQTIYNNAKAMFERNAGSVLIEKYRSNGKWEMLAKQPVFWGSRAHKKIYKVGVWKGTDNTDILYSTFFDMLRRTMDRIWFEAEVIDTLPRFIVENTDILDAMVMCEIYHEQIRRDSETGRAMLAGNMKYREVPYTVTEGGRRLTRYRKVPIFANDIQRSEYEHAIGRQNAMMPVRMS